MCLKKKVVWVEVQETEEVLVKDHILQELTHVIVDADVEELFLFLQCVKYALAEPTTEYWHRSSVFCTRITRGGKLCNFIINSSRTENVVYAEFVGKLGKPKLYQPSWLNNYKRLVVKH